MTTTATLPASLVMVDPSELVHSNYRALDVERVARLAEVIRTDGAVRDPVTVLPLPDGRYELNSGHHRAEACKLLGWQVPCMVLDIDPGSVAALVAAVAGNLTHQASKATEDAEAFGRMIAGGMTAEEIAARIARPLSFVTRRVAILDLDPAVRFIVDRHGFAWAEPLAGLSGAVQTDLVRVLEGEGLNRAQWSELVARYRADAEARAAEQGAMFGGDFGLNTETWDADLARYVSEVTEEPAETVAPVIVREQVLGLADLADRVGAKRATAYKWQHRGQLPAPDLTVSGQPAWWESTVDAWWADR